MGVGNPDLRRGLQGDLDHAFPPYDSMLLNASSKEPYEREHRQRNEADDRDADDPEDASGVGISASPTVPGEAAISRLARAANQMARIGPTTGRTTKPMIPEDKGRDSPGIDRDACGHRPPRWCRQPAARMLRNTSRHSLNAHHSYTNMAGTLMPAFSAWSPSLVFMLARRDRSKASGPAGHVHREPGRMGRDGWVRRRCP